MGSRQTVTIVMTVSVASDEDAWSIVSEYAGLIEDFWTAGAIDAKTHATVPAIATEEAAKDKPSRRSDAGDERDPRQDVRRVGELTPDQPRGRQDGRGDRRGGGDRVGAIAHLARRLEGQELRAVSQAHEQDGQAAQDRVGGQQREEAAGELVRRARQRLVHQGRVDDGAGGHVNDLDAHALNEVREGDAQQQRNEPRTDRVRPVPGATPLLGGDLRAPLERHDAHDQADEDQEEGEVHAREHGRVRGTQRRWHHRR